MRSAAKYIWVIMAVAFIGGFLLAETSGLLGQTGVTTSTVVATVNGHDIPYLTWVNASQQMAQQQEQGSQRGLTLDERRQIDEQAFNSLVTDVLLQQEYEKRGIRVTDAEIVEQAKFNPPPQLQQAPELQTEGRFDPTKYQRFLASPSARQQGILTQLEGYYRTELPKQKLFQQITGDVYVSDTRLWQIYRDGHDSASVSFVAFRPNVTTQMIAAVSDADAQKYYDAHKAEFDRPGRAVLSIVEIARRATAADTAEALRKIQAIREEIVKGAKFADVAKRESDDSVSGAKGGDLGKGPKGRFVKAFEEAAYKLSKGELSAPVKTDFGYHLIKMDDRKGDTLTLSHILKLVKQGDSAATATDRRADALSKLAAGQDNPAKFDSAAKSMGLLVSQIEVRDGEAAAYLGRAVPSASAWAFSGAKVGESSDLFDNDNGYYLVRLDTLQVGGVQPLAVVKDDVKRLVATQQALDAEMAKAQALASAAKTGSLEAAAAAASLSVSKEGPFARTGNVLSLGGVSPAVGAAFVLPVGQVSGAIRGDDAIYVLRVDKRTPADEVVWAAQRDAQRAQVVRGLREQRVRQYLENLRKAAKIEDNRRKIQASQRRTTAN
jgi:peptidyl-prolyl cis-trans isomerase D